jgi:hypothetical protein
MKHVLSLLAAALLAACAGPPKAVPDDYKGPIAVLTDTGRQEDGSKGQFFAALEIDGVGIQNAIRETRAASYGKGPVLTSRYTTRDIPARPMKIKIIATHQTAAPIHEIASRMAGTFFSVEGVVDFRPAEGRQYAVVGELAKEKSCAWITDTQASQPASEKVCTE